MATLLPLGLNLNLPKTLATLAAHNGGVDPSELAEHRNGKRVPPEHMHGLENDEESATHSSRRKALKSAGTVASKWIQCDRCSKWRRLPPRRGRLPKSWFCEMNKDPEYNRCSIPEETVSEDEQEIVAGPS